MKAGAQDQEVWGRKLYKSEYCNKMVIKIGNTERKEESFFCGAFALWTCLRAYYDFYYYY